MLQARIAVVGGLEEVQTFLQKLRCLFPYRGTLAPDGGGCWTGTLEFWDEVRPERIDEVEKTIINYLPLTGGGVAMVA